jgi:hypothetical protein
MALLILKLMMWLSWYSGAGMGMGSEMSAARPDASIFLSAGKIQFDPGTVKNIKGDALTVTRTIVLEDDTHFRPFFNLKK